jgi:hypothetical protein
VLVGHSRTVRGRVFAVLGRLLAVTVVGIALVAAGAAAGWWDWPPRPSSPFGVATGVGLLLIVLFEMALWPRKGLRGRRLGRTKLWMRLHVWVGLVGLPVALAHAGFGFGGPLPAVTLALFLLVTFSGVWGLVMQQWLPEKILADIPEETVASEIDHAIRVHQDEATRLVRGLVEVPPGKDEASTPAGPVVVGPPAADLVAFRDALLLPYLEGGRRTGSPLAARAEAQRRFARLRSVIPVPAHPALARLEALCDLRRQWDALARLNVWLHGWLLLHLPLSVAMTGLMLVHAVRALKYW